MIFFVHCSILCGPVSSSVFIEDCKDCTFVVACQQLRVHGTVQSLFYLHVTSRAIIEDCQQVSFAPYNLTYPELEQHFKVLLYRTLEYNNIIIVSRAAPHVLNFEGSM